VSGNLRRAELSYPDGTLGSTCGTVLAGEVVDAARDADADGLLVFDPSGVTGHPDHAAATAAALAAADVLDLPTLGWTLPADVAEQLNQERGTAFSGHRDDEIDYEVTVERARQLAAVGAHASQALPTSVLWRRLELLGDREYLRRLRPSRGPTAALVADPEGSLLPSAPANSSRTPTKPASAST
jgi:LmbE family N-acetylglucosaminyl deacetylase